MDVVVNGLEAVAALSRRDYDLVLMDVQMPEMDGLQATRTIRKTEKTNQHNGHIPIIALSANAMKGDKERCLAVGMDDYLSKPIEPNELFKVLNKWLVK